MELQRILGSEKRDGFIQCFALLSDVIIESLKEFEQNTKITNKSIIFSIYTKIAYDKKGKELVEKLRKIYEKCNDS